MWRKGKLKDERRDAENPPAFIHVEEKPTCCSITEKQSLLSHYTNQPTNQQRETERKSVYNDEYKLRINHLFIHKISLSNWIFWQRMHDVIAAIS